MTSCDQDVVLYFYGELDAADRERVAGHLRTCEACRQRLEDLHTIRQALAAGPVVDAPPAGDWSGFMRRLDRSTEARRPSGSPTRVAFARVAAMAAMIAVVTMGVFVAGRFRAAKPVDVVRTGVPTTKPAATTEAAPAALNEAAPAALNEAAPAALNEAAPAALNNDAPILRALRTNSAEHLERSKLVVLGLATRDPQQTRAADWQYERELAGSLLADTRLYRLSAQERGVADVARVMRDLETVLLEASMADGRDRESLARVQRLIARRGLVSRMQVVTTSAGL